MEVFFDTRRIQKLGRVALSDHLLRNAGLHEGDNIDIYFDAVKRQIVLKRAEQPASNEPVEPTKQTKLTRGGGAK